MNTCEKQRGGVVSGRQPSLRAERMAGNADADFFNAPGSPYRGHRRYCKRRRYKKRRGRFLCKQLELTGICAELVGIRFPRPNLDLALPIGARWINGVPKVQAYAAFVVDGA